MNWRLIFLSIPLALAVFGALLSKQTLPGSQASARSYRIETAQGYKVQHVTSPGVNTSAITTPNGQIIVNVPSDLYAGDTFTGTMQTEPAGKSEAERAQNLVQLNAMELEIGQQKTSVGDGLIVFARPNTDYSRASPFIVDLKLGAILVTAIPISNEAPPSPANVLLPTGGQIGRNVVVRGPCNGVFDPTDSAKIGGTELKPLAESPRMKIFQNSSQVGGPTQIEFNEQGVVSRGPFQNIGVRLSGNTNLLRGQQGPLNLVVFGLQHLQQVVPVDLENASSNVVSVSGGDVQHFEILPTAISTNGEWSKTFTMTGRSVGVFNITATVRWKNPCPLGQANCEGPVPQCGTDAHQCGEGLKYWCTSDDKPCQPPPCGTGAHQCGDLNKYWCTSDDRPCQPPPCGQGAHQCGEGLKYWCTSDDKPCQPPAQPPPVSPSTPTPSPFPMTGERPSQPPVPTTTSRSTPTPTPTPVPEPSPRYTPSPSPTPPPPRTCVLTYKLEPGPAIDGKAFAPTSDTEAKSNEAIPLFVVASDADQLIQTCSCPPGSQSKSIAIVDSVNYEWTKEGAGKLEAGGPASLYIPPDIPVGGKVTAVVKVNITDSGKNGKDNAKHVKFNISVERTAECRYKREIRIEKDFGGGEPAKPPPGQNECQPDKESWNASPPLTGEADDIVKLCVGERAVLRASGSDTDTLTVKCVSRNCGSPTQDVPLADEMKYTWNVSGRDGKPPSSGGFLSPVGGSANTIKTNGQNTSVIYDAGTAGEYTITVDIENNDKPAPDAKVRKTIKVKVYKLDLEIEGLSKEEKECKGVSLPLSHLKKITLNKEPAEGKMTLKVLSGRDRIEIWEDKERTRKPDSLTFDATEPKDLWIEGVKPSDPAKDVELALVSDDVPCKDTVKLTVTEQLCRVKLVLDSVKYLKGPLVDNADDIGENWKFEIKVEDQPTKVVAEHKLAYGTTKSDYNILLYEGTPLDKSHDNRFVQCNAEDAISFFHVIITATEIARALGKDSTDSADGELAFQYDCTKEQAESSEAARLNRISNKSRRQKLVVRIDERSMLPSREFSGKIAQLEFTIRLDAACIRK